VLVVGAGQQDYGLDDPPIGNGRAMSVLFAREGAAVALADLNEESLAETAELVAAEGADVAQVVADASGEDGVVRMVETAERELGGLDGLVMNVGIAGGSTLEQMAPEDWDRVFATNVRGHFLGCKHALVHMPHGGAIVLIGSLASLVAAGDFPTYNVSKAALAGLARHAAKEGAPRGIRANLLVPGLLDTPLGRMASRLAPERERIKIPLGRQGTAWELAYAATYLLSDESSFVTGQSLVMDGGMYAIR
jgi:NAD(P)-dependent dehydrogenase (short-subunit alcohol dehydrogenase family)